MNIDNLNSEITKTIQELEITINTDFKPNDNAPVTASDIHYLFKTLLETLNTINTEVSKLK